MKFINLNHEIASNAVTEFIPVNSIRKVYTKGNLVIVKGKYGVTIFKYKATLPSHASNLVNNLMLKLKDN